MPAPVYRTLITGGSSNISKLVWWPTLNRLDIYFQSRRTDSQDFYRYANVGPNEWAELVCAESAGKAFHRTIRQDPIKHPFERITRPLPPRNSVGQFQKV